MRSVTEAPGRRDFLAVNRGGGLYSEAVSQPFGSVIALLASRWGLRPTTLTLTNLVLGLGVSVAVVALAPRMAAGSVAAGSVPAGSVPAWAVGLAALVAWQVAYALDCADGQLARVTGQASAAGARLDMLCDVAAQGGLVTALAAVAYAYRPGTPVWLGAAFAATWMVNLVTSAMQSGPYSASMVPSRSVPVRVVKLARDYGAVILVAGAALTFVPQWTVVVLWGFTAVNGAFLLASIAFSARAAYRAVGPTRSQDPLDHEASARNRRRS
jgi:phosphatidylglycerophosphate synthase